VAPRHIVEATSYLADRGHHDAHRAVRLAKQDSRIFTPTVGLAGMFLANWQFKPCAKAT